MNREERRAAVRARQSGVVVLAYICSGCGETCMLIELMPPGDVPNGPPLAHLVCDVCGSLRRPLDV